jgi:hypothetical protein
MSEARSDFSPQSRWLRGEEMKVSDEVAVMLRLKALGWGEADRDRARLQPHDGAPLSRPGWLSWLPDATPQQGSGRSGGLAGGAIPAASGPCCCACSIRAPSALAPAWVQLAGEATRPCIAGRAVDEAQ